MKRWVYFSICLFAAAALFAGGWLLPIHLRAVDEVVLRRAGEGTPGVIAHATMLAGKGYTASADLMLRTAQHLNLAEQDELAMLLREAQPIESQPFAEKIILRNNRQSALGRFHLSQLPVIQQLLRCRSLTNTVLFPPSQSSSGQAFDAALATCGLLIEGQSLTQELTDEIAAASESALGGGSTQPIEQILLDLMSLAQRLTWDQLVAFCNKIENAESLRVLTNLTRQDEKQLQVLFSAVQLSGRPASVANYLTEFSQTGRDDLATSLQFGSGGVNELLARKQRLHRSNIDRKLNASPKAFVHLSWQNPRLALALKWLLYFSAGYFVALALHFARPRTPVAERPFHVRGFHVAREILFALGFFTVVILLSEPYLAQENQNAPPEKKVSFRVQLPKTTDAISTDNPKTTKSIMNKLSLFTLLLFFVLQSLLYVACLIKLAEIRRQRFPANIKLRLLENEEHLFDAGLYLGFAGTIISLILVSMGVIKPSLMAAYSATAFGVIFVSIFKIFHLRPLRRKLLLEAESDKNLATTAATTPTTL